MKKSTLIISLIMLFGFEATFAQNYYSLAFNGSSNVSIDATNWRDAGYAINFDGSTGSAASGSAIDLDGKHITLETWVYVNSFNDYATDYGIARIMGIRTTASSGAYLRFGDIGIDTNQVQFVIQIGGAEHKLTSSAHLNTGEWIHIAGTYDESYMRLYINGSEDNSIAQTGSLQANAIFTLGYNYDGNSRHLNGILDETRVWTTKREGYQIRNAAYNQLAANDTANLEAYYQMSNGSGTTITDNYIHGHDLTLSSSGITWQSSTAPLGRVRNVTMECWVNIPSTSEHGAIMHLGPHDWGYGFGVGTTQYESDGNKLVILSDFSRWIATGVDIGTGWHHIALVLDNGSNFTAYIDGVQAYTETGTTSATLGLSASPIATIGGMPSYSPRDFSNGNITEARFWKVARTQQQIRDDMHFQLAGSDANLLGYYKMTDGSGTTLTDNSANSSNGTITGATWVDSISPDYLVYGTGTSSDKYLMATLNNLSWVTQHTSKFNSYFLQTSNIDATNTQYWDDSDDNGDGDKYNDPNDLTTAGNNEGFFPIGSYNDNFTGDYDGSSYTVSGIRINRSGTDQIGFFGVVSGSSNIRNLGLTSLNISGKTNVGGLIGMNNSNSSIISNCFTTGNLYANGSSSGGLIGAHGYAEKSNNGSKGTGVDNCYSTCNIEGTSFNSDAIGGLIGTLYGAVSNSYSLGNVTRPSSSSWSAYGALIGTIATGTVQTSFSTGSVTYTGATDPTDKGFIGEWYNGSTATNNFFDSEVSNQTTATGATAKTTAQMKLATTFLDGSFSFAKSAGHWAMNGSDNSGYPFLRFEGYTPSQIWLGTVSSEWATTGNWSEETAPASAENIIVPNVTNDLVISPTNATCNNMLLEPNAALQVVAMDGTLTVNGNLTNNGTFTINSDATGTGSLIVNGTATGTVTMQRYLAAATWTEWDDGWHFLSSPVADYPIQGNFTVTPADEYDFYAWSEKYNVWVNYADGATPAFSDADVNGSNNFELGHGYLASYKTASTKAFTGAVNVDDVSITGLTLTGTTNDYRSWNLLGNPFTSGLLWDNTWTTSNIGGSIQIWNEAGKSYTVITQTATGIIPATNGFMVQATVNNASLTIPKAKRTHGGAFYKKDVDFPIIKLKAINNDNPSFQESQLMFIPGSTTGYEAKYDCDFLAGYAPVFYSTIDEIPMAVNSMPGLEETTSIPFTFIKNDGLNFSIAMYDVQNVNMDVWLYDKKLKKDFNLSKDSEYYFTAFDNDNPERFVVHFSPLGIDEPVSQPELVQLWASNNTLNIYNANNYKGDVRVINMFGQTIINTKLTGDNNQRLRVNVSTGYYIVNIITNKGVINRKLYFN